MAEKAEGKKMGEVLENNECTQERINFARGWLRGFFDGEGSIFFKTHSRLGKRHTNRFLSVGNTDIVLMHKCSEYLSLLGIEHTKFTRKPMPSKKTFFTTTITKGASILRFADMVGFNAPGKQAKLEVAIHWISRDKKYRFMDDIINMRKENLSFREIAKKLGLKEGAHSHLSKLYNLEQEKWQKNAG